MTGRTKGQATSAGMCLVCSTGPTAQSLSLPVSGLGLPKAGEYAAFDFWNNELLEPFKTTLNVAVPGAACRVLAVRPLLSRPFLISTSRHVSQGILEREGGSLGPADQDSHRDERARGG